MIHPRSATFSRLLKSVVLAFLLCGCEEEPLEILSIEPRIGRMGEHLTINGSGFGHEQNDSYITIAGRPPTNSSYISWANNEIVVRIPEFSEAGLVYVNRDGRRSNSALFTNAENLPVTLNSSENGTPIISSVEPAAAPIGSLLTIRGNNFGSSRAEGGVFFSWEAFPGGSGQTRLSGTVEAFEIESGYELWSEREVRVRVPDGAVSGNLELKTARGNSRPVSFEVTGMPGTKTLRDKKTYTFSYSADFRIERAAAPNTLYVWMPQPVVSSSQRNVKRISGSDEPFVDRHRGTSLFQFVNLQPQTRKDVSHTYSADVYSVETSMRSLAAVRLNPPSYVGTAYTQPSPLVPSDNRLITAKAAEIIARETLPYARAQRLYEWLASSGWIGSVSLSGGALEALEESRADSYRAALLFTALARAVKIPALPVAGILVTDSRLTERHYWAEFWLDGFGWVPVDPALGSGAAPDGFTLPNDHRHYYFGNLDNRRITFSRGEHSLSLVTPRGRAATSGGGFSLQNLWEEATGGLEFYSSHWNAVTIHSVE